MEGPSKDIIDRLKNDSKLADRTLHLVTVGDKEDEYVFVLSSPSKQEFREMNDAILDAKAKKQEKDQSNDVTAAIRKCALQNIRWPDRDEVNRIFELKPAIVDKFFDEINKAAGGGFEVRSEKL